MTGGLVIMAIALAFLFRVFWRPLAEIALVLLLSVVFLGILSIVVQGHAMLRGS